jgi:hypothetical protein
MVARIKQKLQWFIASIYSKKKISFYYYRQGAKNDPGRIYSLPRKRLELKAPMKYLRSTLTMLG